MKLRVSVGEGYDIIIEDQILDQVKEELNLSRKVLIISDDGVPKEYLEKVKQVSLEPYVYIIRQGEGSKSLENYSRILGYLIDHQFTRTDCIVAVGGGVVGDLSGFVASSYMRGIDFYNIPTTLLSQVDSSIGGKTAVNLHGVKNIVGSFYQPKKVIIDKTVLKTLSLRLVHEGLVEAFKMGLTSNEKLVNLIMNSKNLEDDLNEIIYQALLIKKNVVELDEKETGLRKILNYGHTFGHAIEALSYGKYYHGECVGLGMLYVASENVKEVITSFLKKYDLPQEHDLSLARIIEFIYHDKKATGDEIQIVYVKTIGNALIKKIKISELENLIERGTLCEMF